MLIRNKCVTSRGITSYIFIPWKCISQNDSKFSSCSSHTCDQFPLTQCAGHGTRLQGLVVSGLIPIWHCSGSTMCCHGGLLLCVRLWTQNTSRSCMPREPQVAVHPSHSAGTHTKSQLWNGMYNMT
jgi:hypothetical protein